MKTKTETSAAMFPPAKLPAAKIFGVGGAGVGLLNALNGEDFAGAGFVAVNTDASSLAASSAALKIHLETRLLRGLGTGGDPERGRAIAECGWRATTWGCRGSNRRSKPAPGPRAVSWRAECKTSGATLAAAVLASNQITQSKKKGTR